MTTEVEKRKQEPGLPEDLKSPDDRVIWARASKRENWWPCRCSHPDTLPKSVLQAMAKSKGGSKVACFCFESNAFILVPQGESTMKGWEQGVDEGLDTNQKIKGVKFAKQFPKAVQAANEAFLEYKEYEETEKEYASSSSSSSSQGKAAPPKRKMNGDDDTAAPPSKSTKLADENMVEDFEEDIKCNVCGRGDQEELMLLCDGCEGGAMHTFCCKPPRSHVPAAGEDWFCPKCMKGVVVGMDDGTDAEEDEEHKEDEAAEDEAEASSEEDREEEEYGGSQEAKAFDGKNEKRVKKTRSNASVITMGTRVQRILALMKNITAAHSGKDSQSAATSIATLDGMKLTVSELRETKVGMELNRIGKDDSVPTISAAARCLVAKWRELAKSAAPTPAPVPAMSSSGKSGASAQGGQGPRSGHGGGNSSATEKVDLPARPMASPEVKSVLSDKEAKRPALAAPGGGGGAPVAVAMAVASGSTKATSQASAASAPQPLPISPAVANWEPKVRASSFSIKALVSGAGGRASGQSQGGAGANSSGVASGNGRPRSGSSSSGGNTGSHAPKVGATGEGGATSFSARPATGAGAGLEASSDAWNPAATPLECQSTAREVSMHLLHNALQHTQASIRVEKAVFESFGSDFDKYLMTINGLAFNLAEPGLSGLVKRIVASTADPLGSSGPHSLDLKLVVCNVDNLFQLGIA